MDTLASFLIKLEDKYGGDITLKEGTYVDSKTDAEFTCVKHGKIITQPRKLLYYGCSMCNKEQTIEVSRLKTYMLSAIKIHANKYGYFNTTPPVKHDDIVTITCPKHGNFLIPSNVFLGGIGCCECRDVSKSPKRKVNETALRYFIRVVYGDKYSFESKDLSVWERSMKFNCVDHGNFSASPSRLVEGRGCRGCMSYISTETQLKLYLKHAKEVYGDKYDYSRVVINKVTDSVCIGCPEHGWFTEILKYHLYHGKECPICKPKPKLGRRMLPQEEAIKRAKAKHGDYYDYSEMVYKGSNKRIKVICPKHGYFTPTYSNHVVHGTGCRWCAAEERGKGMKH